MLLHAKRLEICRCWWQTSTIGDTTYRRRRWPNGQVFTMIGELLSMRILQCKSARRCTHARLTSSIHYWYSDPMEDIRKLLRRGKPIGSEPSSIRIVCQSAYVKASHEHTHTYTHIHMYLSLCPDWIVLARLMVHLARKSGLRKPARIFVARSTCLKGVD